MAKRLPRREAILEGMIRIVGRKGYRAVTVADIVAESGVARPTFYRYFKNKHDCFLAAFELAAERIHDVAVEACRAEGTWQERARGGLAAAVGLLAAEPGLARAAVVEAAATGAELRQRYWAALGRLAWLLDATSQAPGEPERAADAGLIAVATVARLIFDELQKGRAADLPRLLPELELALMVPYLGPREADAACRARAASPTSP
jgi:AcrR family transcriptional regulator